MVSLPSGFGGIQMLKTFGAAALLGVLATPAAQAAVVITEVTNGYYGMTAVSQNTGRTAESRVFIATKSGAVNVYDRTSGIKTTLLNLAGSIVNNGEMGLVGLTFDPNYAANGHFYVHIHTNAGGGAPDFTEIRRYTDPTIVPGTPIQDTALTIFKTQQTGTTIHKGGWIGFDKTGMMMIALGDGGTPASGQNASDHHGSILRIDVRSDAFPADPEKNYAIPSGNLNVPGAAPEVYAYGLRNPFGDSIAPDGSLIIADVGQDSREELTILAPGAADRNLGWNVMEGDIFYPAGPGGPVPTDHAGPHFTYSHANGDQSIIGGFVYRGSAVPELFGRYVFGDAISGRIWSIVYTGTDFLDGTLMELGTVASLSSFGETPGGEILIGTFNWGGNTGVYTLTSDGIAAVPEPGSWAMMLAGAGLIGGTLRRRRGRGVQAATA